MLPLQGTQAGSLVRELRLHTHTKKEHTGVWLIPWAQHRTKLPEPWRQGGNTPKHGLIFHPTFTDQATAKNKGCLSRPLAKKWGTSSQMDSFSAQVYLGRTQTSWGTPVLGDWRDTTEESGCCEGGWRFRQREQLLRLLGSWRNRRRNTWRKQLAATVLPAAVWRRSIRRGAGTLQRAQRAQRAGWNTLWFPGLSCLPGG